MELAELDNLIKAPPPVGARPPSRLNYSHDAFIDLILANPGISQNQIGAKLGYSASWVSTVMSTDTFKVALEKRRKEVVDPTLLATVQERFEGIVRRSLEVLEAKLQGDPAGISENLALRSFEVASRAAGFGARAEVPPAPTVEINLHLDSMADNLKKLLTRERNVIEPARGSAPCETPSTLGD